MYRIKKSSTASRLSHRAVLSYFLVKSGVTLTYSTIVSLPKVMQKY